MDDEEVVVEPVAEVCTFGAWTWNVGNDLFRRLELRVIEAFLSELTVFVEERLLSWHPIVWLSLVVGVLIGSRCEASTFLHEWKQFQLELDVRYIRLMVLSHIMSKTIANWLIHFIVEHIFPCTFIMYIRYLARFSMELSACCCCVTLASYMYRAMAASAPALAWSVVTFSACRSQLLGTMAQEFAESVSNNVHWGIDGRRLVCGKHISVECVCNFLVDVLR